MRVQYASLIWLASVSNTGVDGNKGHGMSMSMPMAAKMLGQSRRKNNRAKSSKKHRPTVAPTALASVGPSECYAGLIGLGDFLFDFGRYNEIYKDDSTITLSEAGTYTGPASIEEYVRFASPFSPYFSGLERGDQDAVLKGIEGDVCVFTRSAFVTYTFEESFFASAAPAFDAYILSKVYYNAAKNYIEKIHLYYSPGFLKFFFGKLENLKTYDYVCGIMSSKCGFDVAGCQGELAVLPTFSDGAYVDGNSMGCRALHAVLAETNPSKHCAHISFEPMEDPLGRIKCQESELTDPMDLFDEDDMSFYKKFCEDRGVDPLVGYALLDDTDTPSED